jgi:hypothetical protein
MNLSVVLPWPHVFTEFAHKDSPDYDAIPNMQECASTLRARHAEYANTFSDDNFALHDEAVRHVCRITRMLKLGHVILTGPGGFGKKFLARFSAYLGNMQVVFNSAGAQRYDLAALREDARHAMKVCGLRGSRALLLLSDEDLGRDSEAGSMHGHGHGQTGGNPGSRDDDKTTRRGSQNQGMSAGQGEEGCDEACLLFLEELLVHDSLPDIFTLEDKDEIHNKLKAEARAAGYAEDKQGSMQLFASRVRSNLRVVLVVNYGIASLRRITAHFPALIHACLVNFVSEWDEFALNYAVDTLLISADQLPDIPVLEASASNMAQKNVVAPKSGAGAVSGAKNLPGSMPGVQKKISGGAGAWENLKRCFPFAFRTMQKLSMEFKSRKAHAATQCIHMTGKAYIEAIKLYNTILLTKSRQLRTHIESIENGIRMLDKTQKDVIALESQLTSRSVALDGIKDHADALLEKLKSERISREEDLQVMCVCVCVCTCLCVCMGGCVFALLEKLKPERISREEDLQMICVCVYIYIYTHTCMHIHKHIHKYVHT